jgi:hypothetical protein
MSCKIFPIYIDCLIYKSKTSLVSKCFNRIGLLNTQVGTAFSWLLCVEEWQFLRDVSGQHVRRIFRGQIYKMRKV